MPLARVSSDDPLLRIGLIGPGQHAEENLLPALAGLAGVRLDAVAARRGEAAAAAARRWGAATYTDDWTELVDRDLVDALVVASSPQLHADVLSCALPAGVSVFVEKPAAPDTATLRALVEVEASAAGSAIAFVGFNHRFGDSYQKLRHTVSAAGELRRVDVRMVSGNPVRPTWHHQTVLESLLQGLGTHAVDIVVRDFGTPDEIVARCARIDDVRYSVHILLGYTDGRSAHVEVGNYSNRFEYRCELTSSAGVTGVLDQYNVLTLTRPAGAPGTGGLDSKEILRYDWPGRRGGYGRTGYSGELECFRRSVVTGAASASSLAACLPTHEILDAVLAQAGGGAP